MRKIFTSIAVLVSITATGCASQNPGNVAVYSSNSVGYTAQGQIVTVLGVDPIKLEMQQNNLGVMQAVSAAGAGILGGVIGNSIGKGQGREIARTVGAVGGAAAGASIASRKELRDGWRIQFKYQQDGRWLTGDVKQFADGPVPRVGDEARLFRGGNAGDRVTPL